MSWWVDFYRDMDSHDIDRAVAWWHEDIELRVSNAPAIHGKKSATATLAHVLDQLSKVEHVVERAVVQGDDVFLEIPVTYVFKDGRSVSAPAAAFLRREAEKIKIIHVYQSIDV